MDKRSQRLPSQFPAFRATVARQMEDYRERLAQRIREEATKRGESSVDLAYSLQVHPSTTERWFRGDRMPQRRFRTQLAEHWEIPYEEFEPDLAAIEDAFREQLDRMESMLAAIVDHFGLTPAEAPPEGGELSEVEVAPELGASGGQADSAPQAADS